MNSPSDLPKERFVSPMGLGSIGTQVVNRYNQERGIRTTDGPIDDVDSRIVGSMIVRDHFIAHGTEHIAFQRGEKGINDMQGLLQAAGRKLKDEREPTNPDLNSLALGTLAGYHSVAFRDYTLRPEEKFSADAQVGASVRSLALALQARYEIPGDQQRRTKYFEEISRLAENLAPLVAERIQIAPESLPSFMQTLVRRVADELTLVEKGISRGDLETSTAQRIHTAILVEVERFRQSGINAAARASAERIAFQSSQTRTGIPSVESLDSAQL